MPYFLQFQFLDKSRMDRRIQEMKEEMEHLKTLAVQDQPSLFVWAKNMADMAMRAARVIEVFDILEDRVV